MSVVRRLLAVLPVVAVAVLAPVTARADPPVRLTAQVTDRAGVLAPHRREVDAALTRLQTDAGIRLYVVFVRSFDGVPRQQWTDETARMSGLGAREYLLAVAVADRAYAYAIGPDDRIGPGARVAVARNDIEPALTRRDWAGAVVAAADGYRSAASGSTSSAGWWIAALLVLVGTGVVGMMARRRRRGPPGSAVAASPWPGLQVGPILPRARPGRPPAPAGVRPGETPTPAGVRPGEPLTPAGVRPGEPPTLTGVPPGEPRIPNGVPPGGPPPRAGEPSRASLVVGDVGRALLDLDDRIRGAPDTPVRQAAEADLREAYRRYHRDPDDARVTDECRAAARRLSGNGPPEVSATAGWLVDPADAAGWDAAGWVAWARAVLPAALAETGVLVETVDPVVGARPEVAARAALSEARRHLARAQALAGADPPAALAEAREAHELAAGAAGR